MPGANPNANRGPSDFDIRNAFSGTLTYDVPAPKINAFIDAILRGWSLDNIVQARSAPPVSIFFQGFSQLGAATSQIRPDVVPGQPLNLYGSQYPGGKALNPAAFTSPPVDPSTHLPTRQGHLGRNALRSFGATQWDFAVHRDFPIHESLKLQFRAEMFNVLNHPNFALGFTSLYLESPTFGVATQTLGQALAQWGVGEGALSPLYQMGGPRSIQLALKLSF